MSTLERISARRTWFVPDLSVWGTPGIGAIEFLIAEGPTASGILYYGSAEIRGQAQVVEFGQLTDHRGNQLPPTISAPTVLLRPRSTSAVFVIGCETDQSFQIARDPQAAGATTVDLLIIEMGD